MATPNLSAFCLLFVLMHSADGTLSLDVSPKDIIPGLTGALTVNCTFSFAGVSDMSGIIALIVSKNEQDQFVDLVSLNAYTPDKLTILPEVDGKASGYMDVNSESFLSIVWTHPTSAQAGLYRCEAHGMDNFGHPTEMFQTWNVTSQQASLDHFMDIVGQLQRQLEHQENLAANQSGEILVLQSYLERQESLARNQSNEIAVLQSQLEHQENLAKNQSDVIDTLLSLTQSQSQFISDQQSNLKNQLITITDLQRKLNTQRLLMKALIDDKFHFSLEQDGRFYFLSKENWVNATASAETCKYYGGYLVQINGYNENEFLKNFLDQYNGFEYVLVSGTDEGHEGRWTLTGTDIDLVFTDWRSGEPSTSYTYYNCIEVVRSYNWQWRTANCASSSSSSSNYRFVCELETM